MFYFVLFESYISEFYFVPFWKLYFRHCWTKIRLQVHFLLRIWGQLRAWYVTHSVWITKVNVHALFIMDNISFKMNNKAFRMNNTLFILNILLFIMNDACTCTFLIYTECGRVHSRLSSPSQWTHTHKVVYYANHS